MLVALEFKINDNLRTESASWHKNTIREIILIIRACPMPQILDSLLLQPLRNRVHYEGLKDGLENCWILLHSNNMPSRPMARMNGSPYALWILKYNYQDPWCKGKRIRRSKNEEHRKRSNTGSCGAVKNNVTRECCGFNQSLKKKRVLLLASPPRSSAPHML
jgi:hypothetical protein